MYLQILKRSMKNSETLKKTRRCLHRSDAMMRLLRNIVVKVKAISNIHPTERSGSFIKYPEGTVPTEYLAHKYPKGTVPIGYLFLKFS